MTAQGTKADAALRTVAFSVGVSNDLLLNMAKLKALRMLWYQVARAFGSSTRGLMKNSSLMVTC
jgi:methylmalonyl-CoA mutase N-terminal domain/subunit